MKFSLLALSHLAFAPTKATASHLRTKEHSSHNLRKFDESCIAVLVDTQYEPEENNVFLALGKERDGLSIECLTPSGKVYKVPSADKAFIKKNFIDGDFVSGETTMVFGESIPMDISKSEIVLNSIPTLIKNTFPVKVESGKGRKLAVIGNRTVLAVRVILSDGETTADEDAIRDGIFGTNGDAVNLQTQYTNCSHGQLNFNSVGNLESGNNTLTINDGVLTVNLPDYQKSDKDPVIRNAINDLILSTFGQQPYQIADHVMYCMPTGVIQGIAFAGVNSWYSVYRNEWCGYSAVQMHEIGHNIELGHSGEGSEYADQSGVMGYSYSENDTKMCFNSAKSWQLGWYSTNAITIDAGGVRFYEGDVAGVIEDPSTVNVPHVIKLNTPFGDDFFLHFNLKSGFNNGTKEGANQVMITKTGREGNFYSPSVLLAKLSAGSSWTSDSVFNGEDVTVTVNSIDTRANIKICVGNCSVVTASPSASPVASTGVPISSPSASPSASPVASTGIPTSSPSASPSASPVASTGIPTSSPSASPSASPVASTGVPTSSPSASTSASPVASTGVPSPLPSASVSTDVPSMAPFSASPCIEGTKSKFLLKINNGGKQIKKKCAYLQKLKRRGGDITTICASTVSTTKFKPAKDVCQVTCETCSSACVELGSSKAYWKTVGNGYNHKRVTCKKLATKSAEAQRKACAFDESPNGFDFNVAKVVCPVTCKQC